MISYNKATTDVYAQPGFNPDLSTKLPPMSLLHHGQSQSLTVTHCQLRSLTVTHGDSWCLTVTHETKIWPMSRHHRGSIWISVLSYHQCPCITMVTRSHSWSLTINQSQSWSLTVTHGTKLRSMSMLHRGSIQISILVYCQWPCIIMVTHSHSESLLVIRDTDGHSFSITGRWPRWPAVDPDDQLMTKA